MRLHENKTLFEQAVRFTSDQMKIAAIYVEKDYWVTYTLFAIFNHEIGQETVFKGGTALSKCYNIIERFSEDIDLVVLRREGETNTKLTKKIKTISDVVSAALPEVYMEGLTQKMGMNRKTAHYYNKLFEGDYGQVRDAIVVEATWLGNYEPYVKKSVNSFIGQVMLEMGRRNVAEENGLLPFELQVLEPRRTICEKIMSLVRFSYGENPIKDLMNKVRHTYDLHQLLAQDEFSAFFYSGAFDEMLLKVANDDVASFKNNNQWLIHHPNEALIFKDLHNVWNELETVYNDGFKAMVYGALPEEKAILGTLQMIQDRLQSISWTIKLESN